MSAPVALTRWLGGKRWLTSKHPHQIPAPAAHGRAFDVFAGSGVVALHWLAMGVRVVLADTNARLIGCYSALKERPEALIGALATEVSAYTDAADQRADYHARRAALNLAAPDSIEGAALFLFNVRAGFNGLYREDKRGNVNTSWGDPLNTDKSGQRQHVRNRDLVHADELRAISALLQRAEIRLGDFAATSDDAKKGDALFADAPYADPAKAAFTTYSAGGFTLADRQRLSTCLRELDQRGVRWTATDAATEHARATYGLWTVEEIQVRRSCSVNGKGRGHATEMLIRNWQPATERGR